jgi:hypothetical protein
MRNLFAILLMLLSSPVYAQSATLAVFPSAATDPNTATPVAPPVQYTPVCPIFPKAVEVLPIVNPAEGYYDNPADPLTDCRLNVAAQMAALPLGSNYKAAVKVGTSPYGDFSSAFAMAAQVAHPCDGADPTSGSVVAGTRTLSWCYPDNATGGSPITGWAIYLGATRTTPAATTGTANSAGRRLYTALITVATGAVSLQVAPVNAIGEGARSPAYALSVQAPATAPTGSTGIRGVN